MRQNTPLLSLWRVVLEAASPLSIGTGRGDGVNDVVLATDANGLPALPASSLAGVLRAAVAGWHGPEAERRLFGKADGDRGTVSRVVISHGRIHDSGDRAVQALLPRVEDNLLKPLTTRRPASRQRIRMGHRGSVADKALFDRAVLPAGHRFSVELALWSGDADATDSPAIAPEAAWLQSLLCAEGLRLGAQTRNGLGQLKPVRAHRVDLDLRKLQDLRAYCALSPMLDGIQGLTEQTLGVPERRDGMRRLTVTLSPEAGFRFGNGHRSLQTPRPAKLPDDLPMTAARVVWTEHGGHLETEENESALVPGSSVKGALSHRVAFHAHRLAGQWADQDAVKVYDKSDHCATVQRLFGFAKAGRDPLATDDGQAGLLWVADAHLLPDAVLPQTQVHNSIDRFTGGVRDGLLYSVENLYAADRSQPLLTLDLALDTSRSARVGLTRLDLAALALALDDLCGGRLPLGADSAGGQGFFMGLWAWDGDGQTPAATAIPDELRSTTA